MPILQLEEKALQNVAQRMVEQMHGMLTPKLSKIDKFNNERSTQ